MWSVLVKLIMLVWLQGLKSPRIFPGVVCAGAQGWALGIKDAVMSPSTTKFTLLLWLFYTYVCILTLVMLLVTLLRAAALCW